MNALLTFVAERRKAIAAAVAATAVRTLAHYIEVPSGFGDAIEQIVSVAIVSLSVYLARNKPAGAPLPPPAPPKG